MPASILINNYPTSAIPSAHVQGPILQAMFLRLIQTIAPDLAVRLHDESGYRPFTLSPLGIYGKVSRFQGFWLPKNYIIHADTPCYLRVTFLDDDLLSLFRQYVQKHPGLTFTLGETIFVVRDIFSTTDCGNAWSCYASYPEIIDRAFRHQRRLKLRFLTPTSFSQGKTDLPLPVPRLVFQSFMRRFEQFYQVAFLQDFAEKVDYYVGIANLQRIRTAVITTKHAQLIGFTGDVVFTMHPQTPPELAFQLNLLAEYAFFCGTGKKTTLGMGQTIHVKDTR